MYVRGSGRARRDVFFCARLGDETAAILEPPLSTGAGGHSPDTSPGMVDRPSKRQRGARMRRSRSPWTARGRCDDLASILAGADATEQGALAPSPRVRGQKVFGRRPERPAPPPQTLERNGRCEAIGVGAMGSDPSPARSVVAANIGARV